MAESGVNGIGVNLIKGGFEVDSVTSQNSSWSLGCSIVIEDADADIQEIIVNDITLAGSVITEEISVDLDLEKHNKLHLAVNFSVGSISSGIQGGVITEELVKLEGAITEIQKGQVEQSVKVNALSAEVSTKASVESVKTLEDEITVTNKSIAEQSLKVSALESEIKTKASTETVTQVEGQLATMSQTVAEQIVRSDNIEASIENLVTKETFNAATGEIEQEFTSVKQTTDGIQTTIQAQSGEIASIKENINGLSVGIGKVESDLDSLRNQMDGVTESFFYDYTPTNDNEPAKTWIEEGTEAEHKGDTFTNTAVEGEDAGKSWRWLQDESGAWGWHPIADTDAQKALLMASQALAAADGKVTIFYELPQNYKVGDIWFVHNNDYSPYEKGEILSAKVDSTTFDISHWESKTRYSEAIKDLDSEMKGSFRDGVLDDAERKAIRENLNNLKKDKSAVDGRYNTIIANADLTDAELKDEYKAVKASYDEAYTELVAIVEQIIAAETEELKALFETYETASATYQAAYVAYDTKEAEVTEALMGRLNSASQYLDNITNDGVLTPIEKEQLFEIYRGIAKEYDTAVGNAFNYKIWKYGTDGVTEESGLNGGNGRYELYVALKDAYAPVVSAFTSSVWGFDKMSETTTLPEGYSTTQLKGYLDEYYAALGALSEVFSAITAAIEDAQKAAEQTLSELTGILKPEEMNTQIGKGVVLSTIIATRDTEGNVTAGMNASSVHSHATHGRVVFAGGVSDLTDWNTASFIVYEDGHVVMQSGQIGESVQLGRAMLNSVLSGDIDLLSYPENGTLIPLFQVNKDTDGKIVSISSLYDFYVNGNLVVKGDSSSGGEGEDTAAIGTVTGVSVDGIKYTDVTGGILDLSDAFRNVSVDLSDYYTKSDIEAKGYATQGFVNSAIAGIDLSPYATKTELTALDNKYSSVKSWYDLIGSLIVKDGDNIRIKTNLIVEGDTASGGEGEDTPAIGTVTGVSVNGVEYTDVTAGILDLSDAFNSVSIDLSDYYTKVQVDNKIAGLNIGQYATVTALNAVSDRVLTLENAGYATTGYVDTKIANLINGAPTTLDTLKEIADALAENEDVVDALEAAIGTKANASDLTALAARVTANEGSIASLSSGKADKATTLAGYGITNAYTKTEVDSKVTTINTSITAVSNRVTTLESWKTDIAKYITIVDGNVKISTNLIVSGDTASGGDGEDTAAIGTVTGIKVNGTTYNPTAGIVTIPDYPTSLEWNAISGKPSFATVATSGNYNDLSNRPASLPASDVYAWAKASTKPSYGWTEITGKPTFATVATSGKYSDLSGLPTIPTVPTKVSAFTNDAGYITASAIPTIYVLTIKKADGTTLVAFDPEEEDKTITLGKADVGLGNVENTALSTWAGSAKITTLGTITSGTWNGSKIANSYLANSAMTIAGNSVSLGGSLAVATLQTSLGLGSLAYKSSLVASDIPSLDWSKITSGKPTTISGYGITDAITTGNIGSQSVNYATSAGSATKLATARTIWGQSFDGTGNVSGNLSLGQAILYWHGDPANYSLSANYTLSSGSPNINYKGFAGHVFYSGSATRLIINQSGNVTIGSSDLAGTSAKLYVNGKAFANMWEVYSGKGLWRGSMYTGSLGNNDLAIVGDKIWLFGATSVRNELTVTGIMAVSGATTIGGALTVGGGATITGNSTINGNLVVTGDVASA